MNLVEIINELNFNVLFPLFIGFKFLLETYLKQRNIQSMEDNKEAIPERFVGVVTEEEYKKSINYNTERIRFSMLTALISVGVLLLFTTGGLLNSLTKVVQGVTQSNVVGIILLGLFIVLIDEIIGIPLAIYSTFYLEEKYGFNKTTTKTFIQDLIKNLLISIIFSSTLYAVVISIIERLGDNWWIYAFVAVFLFQAIIFYLYPVLILPLFNKLEPITDEKFKEPIEKLLSKINFKAKGLFVMDGSLRSSHGNAFFTGFGNNKRIVFYDTLLETITPKEMESILGHELGHYKLGHIRRTLISSIFFGFLGFYILGQVFMADQFFYGHGLDEITLYSKFLLFYLVIGSYTFFTKPFTSYISRQREFAADDFSIEYTEVESMISGLLKL
ncbi:MAG: M48 family metallopeptidase, partial [Candidatus Actinomarina sp.]|nr:M48 family metallopeptidase [Candidatus Actinomarina sp.]